VPNLKFSASHITEIWRGSQNSKNRSRDHFNSGSPLTAYLNSSTPISLFTIQLYGATITTEGSLQVSSNVKPILTQNFRRAKNWQIFWGVREPKLGRNVFFATPKRYILRETTSFDVLIVKIRGLAVQSPKPHPSEKNEGLGDSEGSNFPVFH